MTYKFDRVVVLNQRVSCLADTNEEAEKYLHEDLVDIDSEVREVKQWRYVAIG